MEKEALSYGFKAYENRDEAVPAIADAKTGDFDSQMALSNIENSDYDYGFTYAKRNKLNKLDKKYKLGEVIRESDGFVESSDGYVKNRPDIYATRQGAIAASDFIRKTVLPEYKHLDEDISGAIEKEIAARVKINEAQEKHRIKQLSLNDAIDDHNLNYVASRGSGLVSEMKGNLSKLIANVDEKRLGISESLYRNRINGYKKDMANVPESVMYSRFADAIDNSIPENELFNFRSY